MRACLRVRACTCVRACVCVYLRMCVCGYIRVLYVRVALTVVDEEDPSVRVHALLPALGQRAQLVGRRVRPRARPRARRRRRLRQARRAP